MSAWAVFTDLHIGRRTPGHDEDLLHWVRWFVRESRSRGIDRAVCLGDWHDGRTLTPDALAAGCEIASVLSGYFRSIDIVVGNHDRARGRPPDINLVRYLAAWKGFRIHAAPAVVGRSLFLPWDAGGPVLPDEPYERAFVHLDLASVSVAELFRGLTPGGVVLAGHVHTGGGTTPFVQVPSALAMEFTDDGTGHGCAFLDANDVEIVEWPHGPAWLDVPLSELGVLLDKGHPRPLHLRLVDDIGLPAHEYPEVLETARQFDFVRSLSFRDDPVRRAESSARAVPVDIPDIDERVATLLDVIVRDIHGEDHAAEAVRLYRELAKEADR